MNESSDQSARPAVDWAEFRREMPVARRWAYFDHAAVAPISGPARDAMVQWAEEAVNDGDTGYPRWTAKIRRLRDRAAAMIGAEQDEIALVRNTTEGINLVAEGYPWQPGDNVVTRDDEFPANQYPWMHLADRGVETRRIATDAGAIDLGQLEAACDRRTRIIAISWVAFANGWRHDLDQLAEIAHRHGALLFVDAIQGLGVFPLDVRQTPIDFLAADGHKWLLGPEGAGVFFTRREHLDRLRPVGVGWNSVVGASDFSRIDLTLKPSAERYEGGTPNTPGLIGLEASLELLARFPTAAIAQRVLEITDLACERLQQIGAVIQSDRSEAHQSGIVSFELPERDSVAVRQSCLQRDVVLSCRDGRLRISPHAYNDASDIDRLIEALV